jgi:hypothetical protein
MKVTKRIKIQAVKEGFEKIKPGLEIKLFKQITDAPNYKRTLQAIVVVRKQNQ